MKSIVDRAAKFFHLSGLERLVLLQAWLLLLFADLSLRLLPFSTILRYCGPRHAAHDSHATEMPMPVSRIASLVETSGRYCPFGTSCLKEALVLSRLLSSRGIPATLRIGVGRHADVFTAHAWLEQEGQVILGDRDLGSYTPLLSRHP